MATEISEHGESASETSRSTGAASNEGLAGTHQQRRHQLVHQEAANAATDNMTLYSNLKIISITGSSKNTKQHVVGCEYIHIELNGHQ